jgi:hypothetical protein
MQTIFIIIQLVILVGISPVGISPVAKLHLFETTSDHTKLIVQNNCSSLPNIITVSPPTSSFIKTENNERVLVFYYTSDSVGTTGQTKYEFTTTDNYTCDIFMIAGGGSGSYDEGGGGGAGSCIVAINQTLSAGSYKILVGNGGLQAANNNQAILGLGKDNEIYFNNNIIYRAKGGGYGGGRYSPGTPGGCGGGVGSTKGAQLVLTGAVATDLNYINGNLVNANTTTTTYVNLGFKGGNQDSPQAEDGAGGGGIGTPGANRVGYVLLDAEGNTRMTYNAGNGGIGLNQVTINGITYNFQNHFFNEALGVNGYIGGGGGGGNRDRYTNIGDAGVGYHGGGTGGSWPASNGLGGSVYLIREVVVVVQD